MTREEAKDYIREWCPYDRQEEIIKALEQQPCEDLINQRATTCRHGGHCEWVACDKCNHYEPDTLSQQPCDDCISRQAVDELSEALVHTTINKADFVCNFWERLQKLPPVTPKEKTGHWIDIFGGCECSECGCLEGGYSNYCPNCGAKMIESQESEDKK